MNIIEAGYYYGESLRETPQGKSLLRYSEDDWQTLIGKETWIRFSELLNHEKEEHCFFAWDVSLLKLNSLEEPTDNTDPVRYWTTLRDNLRDKPEIDHYAQEYSTFGKAVQDTIASAIAPAGKANQHMEDMRMVNAFDDLAASIKRTGVINRAIFAANKHSWQENIPTFGSYDRPIRAIWRDVISGSVSKPERYPKGTPKELGEAMDALAFCMELAKKSIFWGFESSMKDIDSSICEPRIQPSSTLTRIAFSESVGATVNNGAFCASRILDSGSTLGYFIPNQMVINISNDSLLCEHEGILYPRVDKDLLKSNDLFAEV